MNNLDYLAARYGLAFDSELKTDVKTITSALNILHEQGICAMFLWLYEKPKEREGIGQCLQKLFSDPDSPIKLKDPIWNPDQVTTTMKYVSQQLTENLYIMFFAKDLINATLIYARHAGKVREGNES